MGGRAGGCGGGRVLRLRTRSRAVHRGAVARCRGCGTLSVRRDRGLESCRAAGAAQVSDSASSAPPPVSFGDAFRFWLKLGFISFGGPTGQIAIMDQELVEHPRWTSAERLLH